MSDAEIVGRTALRPLLMNIAGIERIGKDFQAIQNVDA